MASPNPEQPAVPSYPVEAGPCDASQLPTPEVLDLAEFALKHAIESLEPGVVQAPFALIHAPDGQGTLVRHEGGAEAVDRLKAHVAASGGVRAAISWDGYLTVDGERSDALFAQVADAGLTSFIIAQRYEPSSEGPRLVGGFVAVSSAAPLL